jgi:large subunit ribosomal protein L10
MKGTHKATMARKEGMSSDIAERMKRSQIAIFTDYRGKGGGLNVKDMSALRRKLREQKSEYLIVKNTIADRVFREMGITGLDTYLKEPTAVVFGYDDPVGAAKALLEFAKEKKSPINELGIPAVKGAYMSGKVIGAAGVRELSTLPGKPVLIAKLLGTLQAPISGMVNVLAAPMRNLVNVLDTIRSQKEGA